MKRLRCYWILIFMVALNSCEQQEDSNRTFNSDKMIIRLSEIEIIPEYRDEYLYILKEEAKASVALELGVISIYPMYQKENPTEVRILEIYADKKAYNDHLETPYFKHYKTTTLKMVKSLKLVDMSAIDGQTMPTIFEKMN